MTFEENLDRRIMLIREILSNKVIESKYAEVFSSAWRANIIMTEINQGEEDLKDLEDRIKYLKDLEDRIK